MRRVLAGLAWYALLPWPLAAVLVACLVKLGEGPYEVGCRRAERSCEARLRGALVERFALDGVRRFTLDYEPRRKAWAIEAELPDRRAQLGWYEGDQGAAELVTAFNRSLGDPSVPRWQGRWNPGVDWLARHWLSNVVLLLAAYAFLWYLRVRARLQAREVEGGRRCGNGHLVPEDALRCEECGAFLAKTPRGT